MDAERLELSQVSVEDIISGITSRDPVMAGLVRRIGYFRLEPGGDHFGSLVQAIIYQQISGRAADSIYRRFLERIDGNVTPASLGKLSDVELRSSGISPQKIRYLRDLSDKFLSGVISLEDADTLTNREIIERLTVVKGIGVWTAQMFLIFTLGRLNVLPLNDIGFRNALKRHYSVRGELTDRKITRIAVKWAPFMSAGVWILWECENTKLPATH